MYKVLWWLDDIFVSVVWCQTDVYITWQKVYFVMHHMLQYFLFFDTGVLKSLVKYILCFALEKPVNSQCADVKECSDVNAVCKNEGSAKKCLCKDTHYSDNGKCYLSKKSYFTDT